MTDAAIVLCVGTLRLRLFPDMDILTETKRARRRRDLRSERRAPVDVTVADTADAPLGADASDGARARARTSFGLHVSNSNALGHDYLRKQRVRRRSKARPANRR